MAKAGERIRASDIDSGELTYTPTLDFSAGTGATVSGRYRTAGGVCHFTVTITLGTSPSVNAGSNTVSLPVAASSGWANQPIPSLARYYDVSAGALYLGVHLLSGTTAVYLVRLTESQQLVTSTSPFTFASTDQIMASGSYPVA